MILHEAVQAKFSMQKIFQLRAYCPHWLKDLQKTLVLNNTNIWHTVLDTSLFYLFFVSYSLFIQWHFKNPDNKQVASKGKWSVSGDGARMCKEGDSCREATAATCLERLRAR